MILSWGCANIDIFEYNLNTYEGKIALNIEYLFSKKNLSEKVNRQMLLPPFFFEIVYSLCNWNKN